MFVYYTKLELIYRKKFKICVIIYRLKKKYIKWTPEEEEAINEHYEKDGAEFCAKILNRPQKHIVTKAFHLGKKFNYGLNGGLKKCKKCLNDKPLEQFPKNKKIKSGLDSWCKDCHKAINHIKYFNNREKIWRQQLDRKRKNPNLRILQVLRTRNHAAMQGRTKDETTKILLGCDLDFFWNYLEKKFKSGMTKENYGKIWVIDHITPCRAFNLIEPLEQRKCFHYSNLQPLFKQENESKGDLLPDGTRARLLKV